MTDDGDGSRDIDMNETREPVVGIDRYVVFGSLRAATHDLFSNIKGLDLVLDFAGQVRDTSSSEGLCCVEGL